MATKSSRSKDKNNCRGHSTKKQKESKVKQNAKKYIPTPEIDIKKEFFQDCEGRVKAKLPPVSRKNNIILKKERQKIHPDLYPKPGADSETKKRLRMIRNRESAALSRKRKQDRVVMLEDEVLRLRDEVERLQSQLEVATAVAASGTNRKEQDINFDTHEDIMAETDHEDDDIILEDPSYLTSSWMLPSANSVPGAADDLDFSSSFSNSLDKNQNDYSSMINTNIVNTNPVEILPQQQQPFYANLHKQALFV
jgi:hypothetical protein